MRCPAELFPLTRSLTIHSNRSLQIYSKVERLHALHVFHSDFTPRNVVVSDSGTYSIIDFGRASWHECPGELCRELTFLRKQLYIPENL